LTGARLAAVHQLVGEYGAAGEIGQEEGVTQADAAGYVCCIHGGCARECRLQFQNLAFDKGLLLAGSLQRSVFPEVLVRGSCAHLLDNDSPLIA